MPGYTDEGKKIMLEALAPDHVSLHTADPGATGEHEVEGGEYERKAIEWNAPAAGSMDDKSNGIEFPVPAETTVKFVGYWKGGKFVGSDEAKEESFNGAGVYNLEDADLDLNA